MSKPTAEQIVEALRCTGTTGCNCKECLFRGHGEDCSVLAMQAAADMIDAQSSKILELETLVKAAWHDLTKNPDDLPTKFEVVLCYYRYKSWDRDGLDDKWKYDYDIGWVCRGLWCGEPTKGRDAEVLRWQYIIDPLIEPDGYCSRGERREVQPDAC